MDPFGHIHAQDSLILPNSRVLSQDVPDFQLNVVREQREVEFLSGHLIHFVQLRHNMLELSHNALFEVLGQLPDFSDDLFGSVGLSVLADEFLFVLSGLLDELGVDVDPLDELWLESAIGLWDTFWRSG